MKEETVKELDNMTGQVKITKKEFVDSNKEECVAICRRIQRLGITVDEDCSVICGANKDQIADTLVEETEKTIHRKLPKDSIAGKIFNDLPEPSNTDTDKKPKS